jgi:hypothetical protein
MKMKSILRSTVSAIILLLIIGSNFTNAQTKSEVFPKLKGPYLGQKPPGKTPELFAPGIISRGMMERDIAITPDGKEIYYGLAFGRTFTIMFTQLKDGKWSEPCVASFASDPNYYHFEPCLSADGNRIFFLTTRPPKGKEPKPRWTYQNIWAADRKPDGSWGEPYDPDTTINGNSQQYFPSITKDGTLYFTRVDQQTKKSIICRSRFENGKFSNVEKPPAKINQEGTSLYNAFIAHDESYLIACVDGRTNDLNPGKANYYVFFRDKNDNWSDGIPFGPDINIKGSNAMSSYVSPDGKYFFFAAQKTDEKFSGSLKSKTWSNIIDMNNSPQNGDYDIYWVDAKIIEELRPR